MRLGYRAIRIDLMRPPQVIILTVGFASHQPPWGLQTEVTRFKVTDKTHDKLIELFIKSGGLIELVWEPVDKSLKPIDWRTRKRGRLHFFDASHFERTRQVLSFAPGSVLFALTVHELSPAGPRG